MRQDFLIEGQEFNPGVNGTFLHICAYAMRELGMKLMTADGQTITYEDGVYYIGEEATKVPEAMKAIEYYYQRDPEAFEDDHHYIRQRVLQHRLDKFNGT